MRNALPFLSACLIAATGATAQMPADPCRPAAEEPAVHKVLLAHFHVVEGSVEIRSLGRTLPADHPDPAVSSAVTDFNARNRNGCPATNGPVADMRLIAGSLKTRLSGVGFDAAGTTAFAEVTMIGDPETGSGHYVVLRKDNQGWKVVEDRLYRMY